MHESAHLAGKVAVVTGGASGIGKAIALRLTRRGMRVVVADVEQAALDRTCEEIGALGILTDVTSAHSVQALADEVKRQFGGIHLFCSNAGVGSTAKVADMSVPDWSWLLGVNVWGAIHGIKSFLPLLNANPDGGDLIITASVAGFHITPGLGGYTVSKFALVALAETLALELAQSGSKVAVTLLCPGPVRSALGTSQRNRPITDADRALIDTELESTEEGRPLQWIEAEAVVDSLERALKRGDFYVFTHPGMAADVYERHSAIAAAFQDSVRESD